MAEDPIGQRQDTKVPWTKLFTAFRVALDMRKLLLAAAGILAMNIGWVLLSWVFFNTRARPEFKDYEQGAKENERLSRYKDFAVDRQRWNVLNSLAGKTALPYDAGDFARDYEEYRDIEHYLGALRSADSDVFIESKDNQSTIKIVGMDAAWVIDAKEPAPALDRLLKERRFRVIDLNPRRFDDATQTIVIAGESIRIKDNAGYLKIKEFVLPARNQAQVLADVAELKDPKKKEAAERAIDLVTTRRYKPYGRLSTWVWAENRGANPYLLTSELFKRDGARDQAAVPWQQGHFFAWLFGDQFRVLVEPLDKFLTPLVYLFNPYATGFGNRLFLVLVLLWTLLVWGFFGGAITRMAVVQVARNEKISLREAINFARDKWLSYFSAPVFPLILLAVLTLVLIVLGIVEGHTYFLGDILSVIIWPIALLLGMIMAVVLVGLIGWPLMNPTISAEGSDSFDALSRSYSYVYQAPWHYLWYAFLALVYGAALVFFVGLMGSLMVYMGKWGMGQAPFLRSNDAAYDREPTYLFVNAPKSFGWRDLLIHDSQFAVPTPRTTTGGVPTHEFTMTDDYMNKMSWHNWLGSYFVAFWLGLLFLLIVGFGYSYFWTASTIIYLLMRKVVDDTEIDEIHVEEDMQPFAPEMNAQPPAAAAPKAGTVGLPMVESPVLRTTPPPPPTLTPTPMPMAPLPPTTMPMAPLTPAPMPIIEPAPTPTPTIEPVPTPEPPLHHPHDGSPGTMNPP